MDIVEKLQAFTWKLELFDLDFSPLKKQAEGPGRSIVTQNMEDFIKQLRDNISSRFEDHSIPKDNIAFILDPLTVRELSSLVKKTIPTLDKAAIQIELI